MIVRWLYCFRKHGLSSAFNEGVILVLCFVGFRRGKETYVKVNIAYVFGLSRVLREEQRSSGREYAFVRAAYVLRSACEDVVAVVQAHEL